MCNGDLLPFGVFFRLSIFCNCLGRRGVRFNINWATTTTPPTAFFLSSLLHLWDGHISQTSDCSMPFFTCVVLVQYCVFGPNRFFFVCLMSRRIVLNKLDGQESILKNLKCVERNVELTLFNPSLRLEIDQPPNSNCR